MAFLRGCALLYRCSLFPTGSFQVPLWPIVVDPEARPGRIVGRVVASETEEPIQDAEVSLTDMGIQRATNRWGWFEMPEIPPGRHEIRTTFLGRETRRDSVLVENRDVLELEIHLGVEPIPLEGFTVTADLRLLMASGFFRRRSKAYEGRRWTREELEETDPFFLKDVLTTVPGIRSMGLDGVYGRGGCKLKAFIDDMRVDGFDLRILEPRKVEALEVWHGSLKPPEYYWYCGVTLVWLKH